MVLIDATPGLGAPLRWLALPPTSIRIAVVALVAGMAFVVHELQRRARSRP